MISPTVMGSYSTSSVLQHSTSAPLSPEAALACSCPVVSMCMHPHAPHVIAALADGRFVMLLFSLRACLHYDARHNHSSFKINRISALVTASECNMRAHVCLAVLTQPQRHRCPRNHGRIRRLPATSHWHSQSGVRCFGTLCPASLSFTLCHSRNNLGIDRRNDESPGRGRASCAVLQVRGACVLFPQRLRRPLRVISLARDPVCSAAGSFCVTTGCGACFMGRMYTFPPSFLFPPPPPFHQSPLLSMPALTAAAACSGPMTAFKTSAL
jgi:hypothetical protein